MRSPLIFRSGLRKPRAARWLDAGSAGPPGGEPGERRARRLILVVGTLSYGVLCLTPLWGRIPGVLTWVAIEPSARETLPLDQASFWALVAVVAVGTALQVAQRQRQRMFHPRTRVETTTPLNGRAA